MKLTFIEKKTCTYNSITLYFVRKLEKKNLNKRTTGGEHANDHVFFLHIYLILTFMYNAMFTTDYYNLPDYYLRQNRMLVDYSLKTRGLENLMLQNQHSCW